MLLLSTLPLILRINWYGPVSFTDSSSFYCFFCFYNNFHWTNKNRLTMSLTSSVSCASDAVYFYRIFCFYIYCHQINYILLMMSITKLVLTPDFLVHTIFSLFICVLTSPLLVLVFWGLTFLHQQESSPKVVDYLHSFSAQISDFPSKFQNKFYSYSLTLRSQRLQSL